MGRHVQIWWRALGCGPREGPTGGGHHSWLLAWWALEYSITGGASAALSSLRQGVGAIPSVARVCPRGGWRPWGAGALTDADTNHDDRRLSADSGATPVMSRHRNG